jgi:hypothetical protein
MTCAVTKKTTAHQLRNPICAVVMGRLKKKVTAQLRKPTIFTGAPSAHQLRNRPSNDRTSTMPVTIITEFGWQHPLFGYHAEAAPEGGHTHQINLGLISFVFFPSSVADLIDRWRRIARREVWRAETGAAPGDDAEVL